MMANPLDKASSSGKVSEFVAKAKGELSVPFRKESYAAGPGRPLYARLIYGLSALVVAVWLLAAAALNLTVPQLEGVINRHAQSFLPDDASSVKGISKMGRYFDGNGTNNYAYILLEGDQPLAAQAHNYYATLLEKVLQDKAHVNSALDLWSNPIFAPTNESHDGKASYVLLSLKGNMGTALAMESVQAVRDVVAANPPPSGLKTFVTGPSVVVNDELVSVNKSIVLLLITITALVTIIMTAAFRSLITAGVPLLTVGIGMAVARPVVAFLGEHEIIGVSIFASSLLSVIALGAGADYGVFLIGRYQEARRAGEDRESAYYTALRGVSHIIFASGLTVAGATACMLFTRLAIFSTSGLPCTIAIVVTLAAALTLGPAMLAAGSRLGLFEPKPQKAAWRWRRIGTAVVRWPGAVLAASMAVLVLFILFVPTYVENYNERKAQPGDSPANVGIAASDRHLPPNIMVPNLFIVESDHDMRNPTDMIALAKLSNAIAALPGVSAVQSITRPLAAPLEESSLTFQAGYIGNRISQLTGLLNQRVDDLNTLASQVAQLSRTIDGVQKALDSGKQGFGQIVGDARQLQAALAGVVEKLDSLRDSAEPAHDFINSIPNCANIELCQTALTSFTLFDDLDQFDGLVGNLVRSTGGAAQTFPQLSSQIGGLKTFAAQAKAVLTPLHSTINTLLPQTAQITDFMKEVSESFKNADPSQFFFLPSQAFQSPLFQQALPLLVSSDGTVTRMIVTTEMEGFSKESMELSVRTIPAALTAIKGTSLAGSTVSIGGAGGTLINIAAFAHEDFLTSAVAAFAFVFCVVLILLRSIVAALVVIGTVALSFLAAFGAAVFLWQDLVGLPLHWSVGPISFTVLVAVGADYNLLLAARFREESKAGLKTGIIRSMGSTGTVVTTAGLVFGLTMFAMGVAYARNVAQIGTTVGLGLLIDTLLVRSFIVPSMAALLGRWFWWPIPTRSRPGRTPSRASD